MRVFVKNILTFLALAFVLVASSGCPFSDEESENVPNADEGVTHEERDVSGKLALALGGVADGTDELTVEAGDQILTFENNDPDLFRLDETRVVPLQPGIGYATPLINGHRLNPIQITIPPQKLIQIFLGEARGQIQREATVDANGRVRPASVSLTADALGAVIRNRIALINRQNRPGLFVVEAADYAENPPVSYYDAVIEAHRDAVYQFSPVEPDDPSHADYLAAEERSTVSRHYLRAYDQAVLTAADIFNGDTEDPTEGAFAFYSPTPVEYAVLEDAAEQGDRELPVGCGASDRNYPALAPIQVLILKNVATFSATSTMPSFVFIRQRSSLEPAVLFTAQSSVGTTLATGQHNRR